MKVYLLNWHRCSSSYTSHDIKTLRWWIIRRKIRYMNSRKSAHYQTGDVPRTASILVWAKLPQTNISLYSEPREPRAVSWYLYHGLNQQPLTRKHCFTNVHDETGQDVLYQYFIRERQQNQVQIYCLIKFLTSLKALVDRDYWCAIYLKNRILRKWNSTRKKKGVLA